MTPARFAAWKEPDITGELCREMRAWMATDDAPRWITNYTVLDDPNVDIEEKYGASRPRIDIEIERVQRGPRPCFRFEAKRLGPQHPVSGYLGKDGLLALLDGHYPLTHPEAAMLGYVQQENSEHWFSQIATKISKKSTEHFFNTESGFEEDRTMRPLKSRLSRHSVEGRGIAVWHTLLEFI